MMIKYLNETQNASLNSLRTLDLYSNFEDSYKALFKNSIPNKSYLYNTNFLLEKHEKNRNTATLTKYIDQL